MASVPGALAQIKRDLHRYLPPAAIEAACRDSGHRWRQRKLGPVATMQLFVLQILHFNTAINHLRHWADDSISAGAYCRARQRLPLSAVQTMLRTSTDALRRELAGGDGDVDRRASTAGEAARWRGHRTFLTDATCTLAPDVPALRRSFGLPHGRRRGCSYPTPKVLGLFDAVTGLLIEAVSFALFVHEKSRVWMLHPFLRAGDLLVGDRAFCSFAHFALLLEHRVLALFRLHQGQIVDFRPYRRHYDRTRGQKSRYAQKGRPRSRFIRRLGKHDQLVGWIKPRLRDGPGWLGRRQFARMPEELVVREVRYSIPIRGRRTRQVTIVTTLLDEKLYPKEALAELYALRWRIETHWRELKVTLGMDRLKCHSKTGVLKELAVFWLVYNLVRGVMVKAARRQRTTPDRVSFIDALRWLVSNGPREPELTRLVINPLRPGRFEPRFIKGPLDPYPRMRYPRRSLHVWFGRKNGRLK